MDKEVDRVAEATANRLAAVLLFVGVFLVYVRRIPAALVCYGISAACVAVTVVMQVATLIRQVSQ